MRFSLLLGLLALMSCTPPCVKVSQIICEAGNGEQDVCQFLLRRERDDRISQGVCEEILPAAKALGASPRSSEAIAGWKEARQSLVQLGFEPAPDKAADIGNKIVNSGGIGSKAVKDLREHMKEGEDNTNAALNKALQGAGP